MFQKLMTKSLLTIFILLAGASADAFGQSLGTVCPDKTKEPCATAKQMIVSAEVIVTGDEPKGDDWTYMANYMLSLPEVGEAKFKAGLSLMDAMNGYKAYLASPSTPDGNRFRVINLAYKEVYGVSPGEIETDYWMRKIRAKEAWYTTIVSKEISILNNSELWRRQVIRNAYFEAFGRAPNDGDMQYWFPRKEHYRLLVGAQRAWLYSPQGENDLRAAVRKVLYPKYKREPTPAEIDEGVKKVKPGKLIYSEMIAVLQK